MSAEPLGIGAGELGHRTIAEIGGKSFIVLIAPDDDVGGVAARLARRLERAGEAPVVRIEAPADAAALARRLRAARGALTVVSGLEELPADEWRRLDFLRSRLLRESPALLVLSRRSASLLTRFAPNLASFLGGELWRWHADASALSEADREVRLGRLRAWSGLRDDEVVAQAERKILPTEPRFAEWLVLLGRGDLLER